MEYHKFMPSQFLTMLIKSDLDITAVLCHTEGKIWELDSMAQWLSHWLMGQ